MFATDTVSQRALTEKRGKELDRWIVMRCVRLMIGIEPFSLTLSDLPTEILHQVVEKMEPMDIRTSREVCRSMRNVVNEFAIRFGGILLFLKNNTVSEEVSSTFSGLPTKIISQVVEKMEPIDRLRARKVRRSLKTVVDTVGTCFNYVGLRLYYSKLDLELDKIEIVYTDAANGSSNVIHNGQKGIIVGENFVERALKDLKIVSKHARRIEIRNCTELEHDIVSSLIKFLKTKNCSLVKDIEFWWFTIDEVITILSWFNSKVLKKIELISIEPIDQLGRISDLEQWQNAEEVLLWTPEIPSTMIVHFFHSKCFNIQYVDEFSVQTAIQMRDDLLRRSTFQSCNIYFETSNPNPIEIAKVFKPDYAGGNEFRIEYSNGNDKFNISLKDHKYLTANFVLNVKRL